MSAVVPLGRSFMLQALIDANPLWDIELHGYRVTATLRSDPAACATVDPETGRPLPVLVSVMANVLADWRVQHGTLHCRMQRYAGPQ